jgi:magnesium-transporting ATPase (P-type)
VVVPATDVVPGDVLLLAPGDRVAADLRLFSANGLEVDEAALTGESLPVSKAPTGDTDASRVVLEGSDVIVGTGSGVVIAVGGETRLGAIRSALALDEAPPSPLSARLSRLLGQVLPVIAAGGAIVAASGILRGQPVLAQVALGASIAVAAVPEGLPILAKVGEAAVARRLAGRHALVHRLSAVEALGRVDVACTDKTGTLTEGRLALSCVAGVDQETRLPGILLPDLRDVLLTAALAGPHPDAPDATADHTDVAVAQAAEEAGLGDDLRVERSAQSPFDSARSFHAAVVRGRLCIEGAAEALVPRCTHVRRDGAERPLDEAGQAQLLARARNLAERGLRVLMVAEGAPDSAVGDPRGLIALGFLGISDPIRPAVPTAVRRCYDAGVRVIMLTGDHPATAFAIARDLGIAQNCDDLATGRDLPNGDPQARICTFECTFCADCAEEAFGGVCPNCGGDLLVRPTRPTALLHRFPASTQRVRKDHRRQQVA